MKGFEHLVEDAEAGDENARLWVNFFGFCAMILIIGGAFGVIYATVQLVLTLCS